MTSLQIIDEYAACGGMHRHEPGSPELGGPNGEHALIGINILELQIERFGEAHARHAE